MKKISVEVSEVLDRQIRILAAKLDMTRSEFVRVALQEKVKASVRTVEAFEQTPPSASQQTRDIDRASSIDSPHERSGDSAEEGGRS